MQDDEKGRGEKTLLQPFSLLKLYSNWMDTKKHTFSANQYKKKDNGIYFYGK